MPHPIEPGPASLAWSFPGELTNPKRMTAHSWTAANGRMMNAYPLICGGMALQSTLGEVVLMQFGPGFGFTFFYYFVVTTIITTLMVTAATDMALNSGLPQRLGVIVGLIAGVIGGYCNRTASFSVISTQPEQFSTQVKAVLASMDYELSETIDLSPEEISALEDRDRLPSQQNSSEAKAVLCYQRMGWRSLLSGKVFLCVGKKEMTVATRWLQLKRIQRQLDD